ncbi:Pectinesterase inhibitor domain [Macleaya cordata]|uniref:Pectinesterase inhibitor domain n=1 Tax=Macleaya cordata TaxID=56857 RepID=A0A200RA35_MACCD|nr:Pectinesterase inhibitor domain [Macleaya cordata]
MDRLCLPFLILLLLSILYRVPETVAEKYGETDFIKASCGATRYPDLCFESLSIYRSKIQQSPRQLAQAALSVSLSRARSVTNFVSMMTRVKGIKGRDFLAVKDCVDNMGDSVDRLSRSMKELGQMGRRVRGQSFLWHMSNVQTWVSAALTDEDTCIDGFSGHGSNEHIKASIKSRVVKVAQVTSNALALVNRFAAKHH